MAVSRLHAICYQGARVAALHNGASPLPRCQSRSSLPSRRYCIGLAQLHIRGLWGPSTDVSTSAGSAGFDSFRQGFDTMQ